MPLRLIRRIRTPVEPPSLDEQIAAVFERIIAEAESMDDPQLRDLWLDAVRTYVTTGNVSQLVEVTKWRRSVVALDEFLFGGAYLGLRESDIYPGVIRALHDLDSDAYDEVICKGALGIGKRLALTTPIPTPDGWTTMGNIKTGDTVFDGLGRPCTVTQAHPIAAKTDAYDVIFSDGEVITADAEHLWYTLSKNERRPKTRHGNKRTLSGSVKTTKYIAETLRYGAENNHIIPLAGPAQYAVKHLPIDPYILGLWLGDGHSATTGLTVADYDLAKAWVTYGNQLGLFVRVQDLPRNNKAKTYFLYGCRRTNALRSALRDLDVLNNKHIPVAYLQSSVAQRTSLLQGLMDTDGCINTATNVCEFVSKFPALADGMMELLWSLGLKPTRAIKTVNKTDYYRITFTAYRDVVEAFRLVRKRNKCRVSGRAAIRQRSRYIVNVRKVPSVPMRCITVDSSDHLYLAGRGFIPTHNTTLANLATARDLYKLSCMRSPQDTYGTGLGTPIVFTIQSVRLSTAKKVVFEELGRVIRNSPYFRQKFPYNPLITSEMQFPLHNIRVMPVSSSGSAVISMNVIGGQMDEMNFMQKTIKSKSSQADTEGSFDQAKQLYNTLASRRKSRFTRRANLPGALYLISSSRFPDDFTEKKAEEAVSYGGTDGRIYVFEGSQWEVKGRDKFADEEFRIQIGNETYPSKVLEPNDTAALGCDVINVPIDFLEDFRRDVDAAIRDFAGRTILATRPFITQRHKIAEANILARENGYVNAMELEQADFSLGLPDLDRSKLRTDVKVPRAAHIDLGISKDACGIAVAHVAGYRVREFKNDTTNKMDNEVLPVIGYDVVLRVIPPMGGEIQLDDVRKFLRKLNTKYNLNIKWVTFDGFQSADSKQLLAKQGFITGYQSVEKPEPWRTFRDALYDARVLLIGHNHLNKELAEVETTIKNNKEKIDHRPNGTKDVADAVVGVATFLLRRREAWNTMRFSAAKSGLFLFGNKNGTPSKNMPGAKPGDNDITSPETSSIGSNRAPTSRRSIPRRSIPRQ